MLATVMCPTDTLVNVLTCSIKQFVALMTDTCMRGRVEIMIMINCTVRVRLAKNTTTSMSVLAFTFNDTFNRVDFCTVIYTLSKLITLDCILRGTRIYANRHCTVSSRDI